MGSVLIVGASVRAAFASARRAGLTPHGIDLFADVDTDALGTVALCEPDRYPDDLPALAATLPNGPLVLAGGLENYPDIVDRLTTNRPLWGNSSAALRKIRSPFQIHHLLRRADLPALEVFPGDYPVPSGTVWLLKPLRSVGGVGVRLAAAGAAHVVRRPMYAQRFVPGTSCSALFLAHDEQSSLLGVTRQLIGVSWLHAGPFRYCGSIGPWPIPEKTGAMLRRIGAVLTTGCQLRGLFGVDFILADGVPWVVEVNPRYTASVEILEFALGRALLAEHANAFGAGLTPPTLPRLKGFLAKGILFAPRAGTFPASGPWSVSPEPSRHPRYADIPTPGSPLVPGRPICTLFAEGFSPELCEENLHTSVDEILKLIFQPSE